MKLAIVLGIGLALATLPASAADDFAARIVAAHNIERVKLGVPPLEWSDALAADAAPWARHLAQTATLQHSQADARRGEGENLWMGTAGGYSVEAMVGAWASEKSSYSYGPFTAIANQGHVIGHYTQMIWKNTTQVGCALATANGYDVLVCRYAPPGNYLGETPY